MFLKISEKNQQTFPGKALDNLKKAPEKLVWNLKFKDFPPRSQEKSNKSLSKIFIQKPTIRKV